MLEKSINHTKGPPPPVAPKPAWSRQTNTAIAVAAATNAVPQPKASSSAYSSPDNENDRSNNSVTERHPSQKFNRSSSMNQISTNLPVQQETPPARNKSLSVPDSR